MKEKLSKNIGLLLKYVSLFIVVKYSITTIYDIYHMLVQADYNDFLNEYVRVLQNFIFFGSLLSIGMSRIKAFSFVIPFAFWEVNQSFFSMNVAPLIISKSSEMSPEYIRVFIFILIIILFLFRSIWKKRKFVDIFLLLSMSGVLTTAMLFHYVTLKQLDYFTHSQEEKWKEVINNKNMDYFCLNEHLICKEISNSNNIENKNLKSYYENIQPYVIKNPIYYYYFIMSDESTQSRIFSRKPVAFIKYDNRVYYMLDQVAYTNYLKFNERIFGLLAMSSHIVWIFGALYLIYFHNKRKVKTIKDDKVLLENLVK